MPERVVYLFTNVLAVVGLHLLWCTILAQVGFNVVMLYLFYPPSHTLYYRGSYFLMGLYIYDRRVSPITLATLAFHLCFVACSRVSQCVQLIFISWKSLPQQNCFKLQPPLIQPLAFLLGSMGTYSHISDTYSFAFAFWWGKLRPSDVGFKYG